ncbi:hypothetical protein KP509_13G019200 [Ceratopteris richardii]|uniref:RNase III domain-containing protein n=1 Tax=Ceratopteris richardii TaxID=49495 RepID=A0A8T2TDU5_CERRI|nr:hypothetical protein KP509_13G019200 [Ceratopteris richardii]
MLLSASVVCTVRASSWPWNSRSPEEKTHKVRKMHREPNGMALANPNRPDQNSPAALSSAVPSSGDKGEVREKRRIWLPEAPLVLRPRAQYNAASLAYLGDCIFELYVRVHFLSPPQSIDKYNTSVMGVVCCEAQDNLLQTLLKDQFLTEEEKDIVRWGKNVQTNHKKATRRAGAAVYSRASSLETLIGYLYLTNPNRLQEVMDKLGLTRNYKNGA